MEYKMQNGGRYVELADAAVRKGPWTVEEDIVLMSYIAVNGEGGWNNLARAAGLNRNGKSCRLRWLNYLRPGVRRGNFTPEEQALVVELQSRWGNRWSKIAKHLPGRTDNEIKNFWRTKIKKQRGSRTSGEFLENSLGARKQRDEADAAFSCAGGYRSAAVLVTADGHASTNTGQESSTLLQGGVNSTDVPAEPSLFSLDHNQSFAVVHGGEVGGATAMNGLPELVAESRDNFSWAFEDLWPAMAPMQPFNLAFDA